MRRVAATKATPPWLKRAACLKRPLVIFFGEEGFGKARINVFYENEARAICRYCPVQQECLTEAMSDSHLFVDGTGVWGGKTPKERRRLLRVRRQEQRHRITT